MELMSQCYNCHGEHNSLILRESENVECVSSHAISSVTRGGEQNVPLSQLATLVTRLRDINVTDPTLACDTCDACDIDKDSLKFVDCKRVYRWFEIALKEGHIEPSQPQVGHIIGWPVRKFNCSSLWTDYLCWNVKNRFEPDQLQEKEEFYAMCDYLFKVDVYSTISFPPLDECRSRFKAWRMLNESS